MVWRPFRRARKIHQKKLVKKWHDKGNRIRSRLQNRKDFQSRLFAFLKTKPSAKETELFLTKLLQNQNSRYPANLLMQRILKIDQMITSQQRLDFSKKLDDYLQIIEEILETK